MDSFEFAAARLVDGVGTREDARLVVAEARALRAEVRTLGRRVDAQVAVLDEVSRRATRRLAWLWWPAHRAATWRCWWTRRVLGGSRSSTDHGGIAGWHVVSSRLGPIEVRRITWRNTA